MNNTITTDSCCANCKNFLWNFIDGFGSGKCYCRSNPPVTGVHRYTRITDAYDVCDDWEDAEEEFIDHRKVKIGADRAN